MPLYRADQKDGGRFWTDDPNEARYYATNSGYGGGYLWALPTPERNAVLRLESVDDLDQYTSKDLDVGRGIWHVFDALERYPEIEDKVRSEGYTWIHYPDPLSDHPDARTFAYVGRSPQPPARLIERVQDTFHPNISALDAQLGIQPSSTKQERQDQSHRDALVLRKEAKAHDHNLRISTEEATPELWSVNDSTLSVKGVPAIRAWLGETLPKRRRPRPPGFPKRRGF